ncbi:hypothetical protein SARC_00961 [Sphaeroforma arctica JP610]|uniref:Response regulatory domain-containing protein n=1 Tax=Sphaeroforma arctica JP610 TaxID=667725 RepID=A0A0L0GDF5_9EUKA|nr:hypothetical protein SARC_00961 [Sphaeroforma arctica JP610]KNC86916.1 hypothetical protein SARC_00961 [Sphaeroforma arctica JP610]|eukprot:XP_014160818.1 hypothetical protein SARC_00961 [Sphaeroforma arctica JP610]
MCHRMIPRLNTPPLPFPPSSFPLPLSRYRSFVDVLNTVHNDPIAQPMRRLVEVHPQRMDSQPLSTDLDGSSPATPAFEFNHTMAYKSTSIPTTTQAVTMATQTAAPTTAAPNNERVFPRGFNVLLCEDNKINIKVASAFLERLGVSRGANCVVVWVSLGVIATRP